MSKQVTSKDLFDAAVGWYRANGPVPILFGQIGHPVVTGEMLAARAFCLMVSSDGNASIDLRRSTIPLLAAISLGYSTQDLAEVIEDCSITLEDIGAIEWTGKPDFESFTKESVYIEAMKAFASTDALCRDLKAFAPSNFSVYMALGLTHVEDKSLWPAQLIRRYADKVMHPDGAMVASFKGLRGLCSTPKQRADLPNGSALDMMLRSGMTEEPVLRKMVGNVNVWEDTVSLAARGNELHLSMMKMLAELTDPHLLHAAVRGLLSMTAEMKNYDFNPEEILETINICLHNMTGFNEIKTSLVLKINLFTPGECQGGVGYIGRNSPSVREALSSPETLLSGVANELLSRDCQELGYAEYLVFEKLIALSLPEQSMTFEPERLINHIMDSLSTFVSPSDAKEGNADKVARESVGNIVTLVGAQALDCGAFSHRSDSDKVMLIRAGLDMKKFKTIGLAAKGRILQDDLGM
jgi:hypothetical protein